MYSYDLQYTDYNTSLANGLQSLLTTADISDITLAVEGTLFKAHQVILSIFSPYFRELFHEQPTKHAIFFMKNVPHRIMRGLLCFMYEGKVQIPEEDLKVFVETANELKIKGLSDVQLLHETTNTASAASSAQAQSLKLQTEELTNIEMVETSIESHIKPLIANVRQANDLKQEVNSDGKIIEENEYNIIPSEVEDDEMNEHFGEINGYVKPEETNMIRVEDLEQYQMYENTDENVIVSRMTINNSSFLEIDGHVYYRHKDIRRHSKLWMRWRCARCNNGQMGRNCRASLRTNPENILIRTNTHNHPPVGAPQGARILCRERYKFCKTEMDDSQ